MKICIINTFFPPQQVGGAEVSVSLLAKALVEAGHSVAVISLHPEKDEKLADWNGVRAWYLPLDNIYWPGHAARPSAWRRLLWHLGDIWNLRAARRIARILDTEKPDVVHTNNLTGFSVAAWHEAKKRGIRLVHTLRDYSLLCPRATLYHKGRDCASRCAPCAILSFPKVAASRGVDAAVGVSRFTLEAHTRRGCFPDASRAVIFNPSDVPFAPPKVRAGGTLRFGYLGRITQEKGVALLLEATQRLECDWRLSIAGTGNTAYIAGLREKYASDAIAWLGRVHAAQFFDEIDVLVVPSLWAEPFGRVIAEAAARGVPVIASDAGGLEEVMALGLSGRIVKAGDVDALARAMQAYSLAQAFVPQTEESRCRAFAPATVAQLYLQCYSG